MTIKAYQHTRSLWKGALISPLIVPLCMCIYLVAFFIGCTDEVSIAVFYDLRLPLFAIMCIGGFFTYSITFVLVVPMALWLRRKQALSSVRLCIWCAALGPVTLFLYARLLNGSSAEIKYEEVLFGIGCGLCSGIVFCAASGVRLLARHSQKNQDAA